MTMYDVYLNTEATVKVRVKADSKEEAVETAQHETHVNLCHHCSAKVDLGDSWDVFQNDGQKYSSAVEDAVTEVDE